MGRIVRNLLLAATLTFAAPPQGVLDMLREATEALAKQDAKAFLSHFDPNTPNYARIAQDVNAAIAVDGAGCTVEVTRDDGNMLERRIEIDWVMRIGPSRRKRVTVKMTVAVQEGKWKITSFAPADLFIAP
jgi:hypothetical protein